MRIVLFGGLRPFNPKAALRDVVAGVTLASMNIPQVPDLPTSRARPSSPKLYTGLLPLVGARDHDCAGVEPGRVPKPHTPLPFMLVLLLHGPVVLAPDLRQIDGRLWERHA